MATQQADLFGNTVDEAEQDSDASCEREPCPKGCGAQVYPRNRADHYATDCPVVRGERAADHPDQVEVTDA
jgi:hypothetical protein